MYTPSSAEIFDACMVDYIESTPKEYKELAEAIKGSHFPYNGCPVDDAGIYYHMGLTHGIILMEKRQKNYKEEKV